MPRLRGPRPVALLHRIRRAGIDISRERLLWELGGIREVIDMYPRKPGQRVARRKAVLSQRHEFPDCLLSILALPRPEEHILA
ncbi:MAG: hypothetical protein ABSG86_11520 [Thermoguttaceae bacterium]